jgi:hypothetical protein
MSLKFKFIQGLNHFIGLNGFKPGHCSPSPPVSAFPSPVSSTWSARMRVTRHRSARPTLSSRASRASPPSPISLLPLASDRTPPSPFLPLSASAQQPLNTPPQCLLQFTRARPHRRPSNCPPMSAFYLLSALGRRHAATSPVFDQNTVAFLSSVSTASTGTPCDSRRPHHHPPLMEPQDHPGALWNRWSAAADVAADCHPR